LFRSPEMLALGSEAAREAERRARVHLKIDTGMGRNGVLPWQIRELGAARWEDEFIQVAGAWTHLTTADDPEDPATDQQVELFDRGVAALADEVGPILLQHIANPAAALTRPDLHRDLVRVGIALYGCPPVATDVPLRPAMTLTSRLALVKEVGEGHSIGYGRIRSTDRRTWLGLVPIGYAD